MPSIQGTPVNRTFTTLEGTTRTQSMTVAAGGSRGLVLCIAYEITSHLTNTVTRDGQSFVLLDRQVNATWGVSEMWLLVNPNVGTADASIAGNSTSNGVLGYYVLEALHQTTPNRTPAKATGASGTASATVAGVQPTDLLIDALDVDNTDADPAPGANQTQQWNTEYTPSVTTGASSTQSGADGGVMSWTQGGVGRPWSIVAVAFIHAGEFARPDADISAGGWT